MELRQLLDTNTPRKKPLGGYYQLGFELCKFTELSDDDKGKVMLQCLEVAKKLAKVADAIDDYIKLEDDELKDLVGRAKASNNHPELVLAKDSSRLEGKVEEALTQSKSALDVAVKVLRPLVGINLPTYGKKGQKVVNTLNKNLTSDLKERAEDLINIINLNEKWLAMIINRRDDQHFKNIDISPLRAKLSGESELPYMPSGQLASEFLDVLYHNLFLFLQDFLAASIYIRLIPGLAVVPQGEGLNRSFRVGILKSALQNNGKG